MTRSNRNVTGNARQPAGGQPLDKPPAASNCLCRTLLIDVLRFVSFQSNRHMYCVLLVPKLQRDLHSGAVSFECLVEKQLILLQRAPHDSTHHSGTVPSSVEARMREHAGVSGHIVPRSIARHRCDHEVLEISHLVKRCLIESTVFPVCRTACFTESSDRSRIVWPNESNILRRDWPESSRIKTALEGRPDQVFEGITYHFSQKSLVEKSILKGDIDPARQRCNPACGHGDHGAIAATKAPQATIAAQPRVWTDGDARHIPIRRLHAEESGPELIVSAPH